MRASQFSVKTKRRRRRPRTTGQYRVILKFKRNNDKTRYFEFRFSGCKKCRMVMAWTKIQSNHDEISIEIRLVSLVCFCPGDSRKPSDSSRRVNIFMSSYDDGGGFLNSTAENASKAYRNNTNGLWDSRAFRQFCPVISERRVRFQWHKLSVYAHDRRDRISRTHRGARRINHKDLIKVTRMLGV